MDLDVITGHYLPGLRVLHRVEVYDKILKEEFTKCLQDSAAKMTVVFFIENVNQIINTMVKAIFAFV